MFTDSDEYIPRDEQDEQDVSTNLLKDFDDPIPITTAASHPKPKPLGLSATTPSITASLDTDVKEQTLVKYLPKKSGGEIWKHAYLLKEVGACSSSI